LTRGDFVSLQAQIEYICKAVEAEENEKSYAERKVGKSRDASKKQKLQRAKSIANIQKGEVYVLKRDRQVRYPESKNQRSEKHYQTTLKHEINEELVTTGMAHLIGYCRPFLEKSMANNTNMGYSYSRSDSHAFSKAHYIRK
jgi:hypothetical protein